VSGVSCSRALKWFIVLLLPLTFGWRLAVNSYIKSAQSNEPQERVIEEKVVRFLARNHFNVVGAEEVVFGLQLLRVTAGLCRMRVALSSSRGWHRDSVRNLIMPGDQAFIVFAGRIYQEQPMWLTVSDFLWSRFLFELGLSPSATPVINVIATPDCEAERLPWNELR
jgi:hypothetical protein